MTEDWVVRGYGASGADGRWLVSSLRGGLEKNSYFHGVAYDQLQQLATKAVSADGWEIAA